MPARNVRTIITYQTTVAAAGWYYYSRLVVVGSPDNRPFLTNRFPIDGFPSRTLHNGRAAWRDVRWLFLRPSSFVGRRGPHPPSFTRSARIFAFRGEQRGGGRGRGKRRIRLFLDFRGTARARIRGIDTRVCHTAGVSNPHEWFIEKKKDLRESQPYVLLCARVCVHFTYYIVCTIYRPRVRFIILTV